MKKCKLVTQKRGGEKLKVSSGDKLQSHRRTGPCYDDDDDDDDEDNGDDENNEDDDDDCGGGCVQEPPGNRHP